MANLSQVGAWLARQAAVRRLKPYRWYYFTHNAGYASLAGYRSSLEQFSWDTANRALLIFTQHPQKISERDLQILAQLAERTTNRGESWLVDIVFNYFPRRTNNGLASVFSTRAGKEYRYHYGNELGYRDWVPPVRLRGR